MADVTRIRAQAAAGNATVRVLISHEMETGRRKDEAGNTIPSRRRRSAMGCSLLRSSHVVVVGRGGQSITAHGALRLPNHFPTLTRVAPVVLVIDSTHW